VAIVSEGYFGDAGTSQHTSIRPSQPSPSSA
jgi:hypothetical protein